MLGENAIAKSSPPRARNRARRFQIAHASQAPFGAIADLTQYNASTAMSASRQLPPNSTVPASGRAWHVVGATGSVRLLLWLTCHAERTRPAAASIASLKTLHGGPAPTQNS